MLINMNASEEDLIKVVKLHKQQYSRLHFTSLFPDDLLFRYYKHFLRDGCGIVTCRLNADMNSDVDGFVACGENVPQKIALFKKNSRVALLKTALQNPLATAKKIIGAVYYKFFDSPVAVAEAPFLIISIVSNKMVRGIGEILLKKCCDVAKGMGHKVIGLYVRVSNLGALKFYLRNGFKIMGYNSGQYYMEMEVSSSASKFTDPANLVSDE